MHIPQGMRLFGNAEETTERLPKKEDFLFVGQAGPHFYSQVRYAALRTFSPPHASPC